MVGPSWIAIDWGTSNVRAWAIGPSGAVLAQATSKDGVGKMAGRDYEDALMALIAPWLGDAPMDVVICGMAGARNGWIEAPYRAVPCGTPIGETIPVATRDQRVTARIIPGLKQASPADVMRGEETQIAGFLADAPKFDGVLCLPGTHSKWAHISAQEVVSFRTFMTGDLYAALAKHSILAATVLGAEGADEEAFIAAVAEMLSKPETLGSALFSIRAETLLNDQGAQTGAARLSGLLIGAELAASRPYWLGQDVVLIGEEALSERYLLALGAQGVVARVAKACDMTLAGLAAARAAMARTPA